MGHAEVTSQQSGAATKRISLDEYWMPFTPNRDFKADPKMVVRAEGMFYWTDRGEKVIDASSGLFCVNAGHGRKEIAEAVGRQMAELDFVPPFLRGHPKQFELATRVAELTPGDLNRIFFTNSGSEAVDSAMKLALAYHQARGRPAPGSSPASALITASTSAASRCRGSSTIAASSDRDCPGLPTCGTRTSRKTSSRRVRVRTARSWPKTSRAS
jgi:acetylornithine/succinyldiaminopimelate/putrescine aminotransferase